MSPDTIFFKLHEALVKEQEHRGEHNAVVTDPVDGGSVAQWVLNERQAVLTVANEARKELGGGPIAEEELVRLAEREACGHFDYSWTYAIKASLLVMRTQPVESLLSRINRVINVPAFEAALKLEGLEVLDFQLDWPKYGTFDKLPKAFQLAITKGEESLQTGVQSLA